MENNYLSKKGMSHRAKLLTSFSVYFCTFSMGLSANFLSASLVELSSKFNEDISTLSMVFSILTISFLVGVTLSGPMYNYFNRQLSAAILMIILGISVILLPQAPSLVTFFIVAGLVGVAAGGYDNAQIVWIIEMWENPGVYIQIQHFSFALGALISPLLIEPFLSIDPLEHNHGLNFTSPLEESRIMSHHDTDSFDASAGIAETSRLFIAFLIGGLVTILGAIFILLLFVFSKYESPAEKIKISTAEAEAERCPGKPLMARDVKPNRIVLVTLSAIFLGAYRGMEMSSMQFIPSFTHYIDLRMTKQDGALVLSALTASFTLGRGIGILTVLRVLPEMVLLGNVIVIILGNGILLFSANSSAPFLWVGSLLLGFGCSTVFPSFYGYIEKHLEISNVVGAIMIVAGGLVSALYPIVIGSMIEENPFVLMYTIFFSVIVCTISFLMIFVVTRSKSSSECLDAHQLDTAETSRDKSIPLTDGSVHS